MSTASRCFLCPSILLAAVVLAAGATTDDQLTAELRQQLALPLGVPLELVGIATSKDEKYTDEQAQRNAPDIVSLEGCHVGRQRVLFKITFARPPVFENGGVILYADLDCDRQTGRQDGGDVRGVDLMVSISGTQVSTSYHNPTFGRDVACVAGAKRVGRVLYIVLDSPLKIEGGKVRLDVQLLTERRGGRSDSTPRTLVELPAFPERDVPKLTTRAAPDLRPLSDFRYHDDLAKYERLADKGLTFEKVKPEKPFAFGRPRPCVPFARAARKPGVAGSLKLERVPVELLEEAGVGRGLSPVSFGLPLAQGALFDLENLRVVAPGGEEVMAQFTATSFWPDSSLKSVLVDFAAPLAARQARTYTVELGRQVRRASVPTPLSVKDADDSLVVMTGPLKVEISKKRFNLLGSVWLDGRQVARSAPEGVRLVDEHGRLFTTAGRQPDSVAIEEQGPAKVVVRVAGSYAAADGPTYMRYIARLVFRAGSPRVTLVYTHVNDYLKTEFTDITSLSIPLVPTGGIPKAAVYLSDAHGSLTPHAGRQLALLQLDERSCSLAVDGRASRGGAAPGVVRSAASSAPLSAVVHDFWQRWPKGLSADGKELCIDLLPKQPGPDYGCGLPHYLLYPFVEGFYRFKWGMSFTDRVTIDFAGSPAEELAAEANTPVVAVLPASWYAQTKALGPMAAPLGQQFALWDKYVAGGYESYLRRRAEDRAFGYFNYGDWYGERGRNWGNNEYDLAHGYFMQFARTGRRDYFRLAMTAARHQADVDCVHAYPDGYNVGANLPHSIGHTGSWSERPTHGTWTYRYGGMTSAANGHTWSSGMVDAWLLAGEAPVMESVLALGEHIAWAMSRNFTTLGTHERSAGWSLKAILSIYRATYDPLYLDAARRIAAVALREQKFNDGGAWAHLLPEDHAGGRPGARGNAIFLMGILMEGLKEYHEETHDPAVPRSLASAAEWVLKCWDATAEGWPYTAMVSGEPLSKPRTSSNLLLASPLAYVGQLTGDRRFIDVAQTALGAVVRSGSGSDGKSIAAQMNFTSDTLALLQQWNATHCKDRGAGVLTGSGNDLAEYLAKTADADGHNVREPLKKIFFVRLRDAPVVLVAGRKPHGAMAKRAEFGTIEVLDSFGATVKRAQFSTDDPYELQCPLSGTPGTLFKVVVTDDHRSVWSLKAEDASIVAQTVPGFCIGGVGRGRYHFLVPPGTKQFCVKLRGGHQGSYAGVVLSPSNQIMGFYQGVHPDRGVITVAPAPADTGKPWSLVLVAGGDMYCELEGVPPYLALKAEACTLP